MSIVKFIKNICKSWVGVGPANEWEKTYKLYETSLFGALHETGIALSLEKAATHIYESLQNDRTVYIEKRGDRNRSTARDNLIHVLKNIDKDIQVPLADNTVYLKEKWLLKSASRPFLMVKKTN